MAHCKSKVIPVLGLSMNQEVEDYAKCFLEISSEQRLRIIHLVNEKKYKLSELAKKLDATVSEVHRNLDRLEDSGFIVKTDGTFKLTALGKVVLKVIPNISFVAKNAKIFEEHPIDSVPPSFVTRLGDLSECVVLESYVDVFEYWKKIYENSEEYIYNILYDVPYFEDFTKPIQKKLTEGVKIKSILYEKAMVSSSRGDLLKKLKKFIDNGDLQRMMTKKVNAAVLLNEKQSCIVFPNNKGKIDASCALAGETQAFNQWCLDYFEYSWKNATPFVERKLAKS